MPKRYESHPTSKEQKRPANPQEMKQSLSNDPFEGILPQLPQTAAQIEDNLRHATGKAGSKLSDMPVPMKSGSDYDLRHACFLRPIMHFNHGIKRLEDFQKSNCQMYGKFEKEFEQNESFRKLFDYTGNTLPELWNGRELDKVLNATERSAWNVWVELMQPIMPVESGREPCSPRKNKDWGNLLDKMQGDPRGVHHIYETILTHDKLDPRSRTSSIQKPRDPDPISHDSLVERMSAHSLGGRQLRPLPGRKVGPEASEMIDNTWSGKMDLPKSISQSSYVASTQNQRRDGPRPPKVAEALVEGALTLLCDQILYARDKIHACEVRKRVYNDHLRMQVTKPGNGYPRQKLYDAWADVTCYGSKGISGGVVRAGGECKADDNWTSQTIFSIRCQILTQLIARIMNYGVPRSFCIRMEREEGKGTVKVWQRSVVGGRISTRVKIADALKICLRYRGICPQVLHSSGSVRARVGGLDGGRRRKGQH